LEEKEMKSKLWILVSVLLLASMALAACQTEVKTVVVKETSIVTQKETEIVTVKETEIVVEPVAPFTTPHPILGDLRVRQAMALCTDKAAVAQAGYPLLSREQAEGLVLNTFIQKGHWAYAGDENITIYPYDPVAGGAKLDEAGWTLAEGAQFRANAAGDELSLQLTTTTAAFRQAWAAVWEQQMAACGIRIIRLHAPSTWWFGDTTGLARRDFELGAYAWVGQFDPGGYSLWACDQIPFPSNGWVGQNTMGWCNPLADAGIKKAVNSLAMADRIEGYKAVQKAYTEDVPAIPLFNRTETFSAVVGLAGFAPTPGEEYYTYNIQDWVLTGTDGAVKDTIVIGFTQPPASLYTLVESGYSAVLAVSVIGFPRSYKTLNYTATPYLVTELSTLESGLALNNDVQVQAGDKILDANGTPVVLAADMQVYDNTGAVVTYDGTTPVTMKQLVITYPWRNDLVWSDGVPLAIEDFKLSWKTACDPENGATSFYTCDRTKEVAFAEDGTNTYTMTFIPGYQDALYYLAPIGFSPAHRIIETEGPYKGMTLADVPAKDWPTLPEIAEKPIDVGPYMIVENIPGEKIVYVANPYAAADLAPKTPNLVILMITPENAEAQLLAGAVDMLDSTTLAGLTEQLVTAEAEGKVKNFVISGATWEHIDINMFIR
jgi:ABC-type transport system substrate-binding protein